MEDYFVSHFGKFGKSNGRLLTRIREGKGLLRIMNGGWKIILYRVLEIGKFGKECKPNGRLL